MSLTQKIAHNTLVQIIGKALGISLSLASVGLLTRYLGQTGFGYYTTIFAFLQIFGILVDFGLQMTTVQMISDIQNNEAKILGNILGLRLTASVVFLGLAPLIALFFPYPIIVKAGILILAISFILNSLVAVLIGVFQKYLVMSKVALADLINKATLFILIALTFFTVQNRMVGLIIILAASIMASFLNFSLLFSWAKKYIPCQFYFQITEWRKIISKTWPIALTIALNLIYFKADTIILSLFRNPAEVGIYGAPYKILEVLINLVYLFLVLLLPLMANYFSLQNYYQLKDILQKGFDSIVAITIPMILGIYFLGIPIMTLVAGEEFLISGIILKILILATGAIFIAALFGYGVVAIGKQKQMIKFYLINALISLGAYLIFIPKYSYWAAAWITVFTEVFILLTAYGVIYKNLKFIPNLKILYKSIIASVVMCLPLYLFSSWNLFLLIFIATINYLRMMYLIKGFSKELILEIIKIKK